MEPNLPAFSENVPTPPERLDLKSKRTREPSACHPERFMHPRGSPPPSGRNFSSTIEVGSRCLVPWHGRIDSSLGVNACAGI